ncbi:uncharacterized protein LOC115237497 [Formica exsecta]|uniref:uncharacterized protein LOC115237497 n=1 Tax=Formica exsecta TaxID=72781 RepID=UPI001141BD92|nr:uncharacterized protein LOC115237497 [Formica exsecta]
MPSLIELVLQGGRPNASWWAKDLAMGLLRVLLNLVCFQRYQYTSEIQIPGFVNIKRRQLVRALRRHEREFLEDVWEDNGPDGLHLDLRRLFGLEPYEEPYVMEESWDEPPSKRSKN